MGSIIFLSGPKGGVGKTTLIKFVAPLLGRFKNILILDLSGTGDISHRLGILKQGSLMDFLRKNILPPSTKRLGAYIKCISQTGFFEKNIDLAEKIDSISEEYLIIIDTFATSDLTLLWPLLEVSSQVVIVEDALSYASKVSSEIIIQYLKRNFNIKILRVLNKYSNRDYINRGYFIFPLENDLLVNPYTWNVSKSFLNSSIKLAKEIYRRDSGGRI